MKALTEEKRHCLTPSTGEDLQARAWGNYHLEHQLPLKQRGFGTQSKGAMKNDYVLTLGEAVTVVGGRGSGWNNQEM